MINQAAGAGWSTGAWPSRSWRWASRSAATWPRPTSAACRRRCGEKCAAAAADARQRHSQEADLEAALRRRHEWPESSIAAGCVLRWRDPRRLAGRSSPPTATPARFPCLPTEALSFVFAACSFWRGLAKPQAAKANMHKEAMTATPLQSDGPSGRSPGPRSCAPWPGDSHPPRHHPPGPRRTAAGLFEPDAPLATLRVWFYCRYVRRRRRRIGTRPRRQGDPVAMMVAGPAPRSARGRAARTLAADGHHVDLLCPD